VARSKTRCVAWLISSFINAASDVRICLLRERFWILEMLCLLLTLRLATITWKYSQSTGSISHLRGHFPLDTPDFSSFLFFRLASVHVLCTKLLKPLVKRWRSEAKSIMVYLDDGLRTAVDKNKAKIASLQMQVHSDLLSSQRAHSVWLGAVLNTSISELSATNK